MKKVKGIQYPNQGQRLRPLSTFYAQQETSASQIHPDTKFLSSSLIQDVLRQLSQLQGQNPGGKVEMGMLPFGWLVKQAAKTEVVEQPPQEAVFENVEIRGICTPDNIELEMGFDVVVLKEGWTQLSLTPSSIGIHTMEIDKIVDENDQSEALKTQPSPEATADREPTAYVAVSNGYYKLYNYSPAHWHVKLVGKAAYSSHQKREFSLWIPESTCANLWLTVPKADLIFSVEGALEQSQTIADSKSTVSALLPPTNRIAVGWTDRLQEILPAADEEKEEIVVAVTAEQEDMITIGEVLLNHVYTWNLNILHGPRFSFEIEIPESLVIRKVLGSGIKSWEVTTSGHKASDVPPGGASTKPAEIQVVPPTNQDASSERGRRVLRVHHQYGAEGNYQLTVIAETPMKEREGVVTIASCKMCEVERETGFVAIDAPSNVEVTEKGNLELLRVDIQEIPRPLQNRASASILYAYKFVGGVWSVSMDIKRHQDLEVLIAVIDQAWIYSTVTVQGKVQTKIELQIRNTTRQYLRIQLPEGATIWSSEVNRSLVKPAHDTRDNSLMIPLDKSTGVNQGKASYWVDVVYMCQLDALKGRGQISMTLPSFDLPANFYIVELHLPKSFKYGEFEGDLRETERANINGSRLDHEPVGLAVGGDGGGDGEGGMDSSGGTQYGDMEYRKADLEREKDRKMEAEDLVAQAAQQDQQMQLQQQRRQPQQQIMAAMGGAGQAKGIKPVRVEKITPEGQRFLFERLLADQEKFSLQVQYKELREPFWKKRHVGACFGLCSCLK